VFSWGVLVLVVVGEGSFFQDVFFFLEGKAWEKKEEVRREGSTQAKRVSGQVECGRDETVHKAKQENPMFFFFFFPSFFIKWEQVWSNGRGRGKPGQ
jgi:hypothetical protein